MAKCSSLSGSSSHIPLMDTERDIQDTICSLHHLSLYQQVCLNDKASPIYTAKVKTGVFSACIPRTHLFPEFVYWLVYVMYPGKCFIMNYQGENVLQVSSQLIRQALCYPESESYVQFTEDSLMAHYDSLAGRELNQFIFFLKLDTKQFVPNSKEFPMEFFDEDV